MTSRTATTLSVPTAQRPLITAMGWLWIVVLGTLFVILHYNFLRRMAYFATSDPNWQHALIVPLISLYFILQHRQKLITTPRRVSLSGLIILFVGLFSFAIWIYPGRNEMFQGYSMILALFGLVWFLLGPHMLRYLWFPIAYLVFAIKVSNRIWERIAWVLQDIAASASAAVLKILGLLLNMDVELNGNQIHLWNAGVKLEALNVAEQCSGLRMLMAFMALGAAWAFLFMRQWWQRLIMVLMAVPIALLVNVSRVTVIGILYAKVDPRLASGDFHVFVGLLMLIPAAAMFWLMGWILDNIVITTPEAKPFHGEPGEPSMPGHDLDQKDAETARSTTLGQAVLQTVKGLLTGGALATGAGLAYGLAWTCFQPERLMAWLSQPIALGLLVVMVLVIIGTAYYTRQLVNMHTGHSRTIAFGIGSGVLLVAVLGLNGVVYATKTVLIKEPIELRVDLKKLPKKIGTWEMVSQATRVSKDIEDVLGTRIYLQRSYVNRTYGANRPEAHVSLYLAYYTGTLGLTAVAHVPERCFLASGTAVDGGVALQTIELQGPQFRPSDHAWIATGKLRPQGTHIPDRFIEATRFKYEPHGPTGRAANVFYFFVANGKFLPTPDHVRLWAFDPRDRYAYYCKVEVGLPHVADTTKATERASAFLSAMMPEIMACLPNWLEVKQGLYPPKTLNRLDRSSK